jgi:hypothetical protein
MYASSTRRPLDAVEARLAAALHAAPSGSAADVLLAARTPDSKSAGGRRAPRLMGGGAAAVAGDCALPVGGAASAVHPARHHPHHHRAPPGGLSSRQLEALIASAGLTAPPAGCACIDAATGERRRVGASAHGSARVLALAGRGRSLSAIVVPASAASGGGALDAASAADA